MPILDCNPLNESNLKGHVIYIFKASVLLFPADADKHTHNSLELKNSGNRICHGYGIPDRYLAGLGNL